MDDQVLKQDQFFLTGTDFSELVQLENNLNELSSMRDATAQNLKVAKFKKIDWTTIEEKLMKGPQMPKIGESRTNTFKVRRGFSHDMGRDNPNKTKLFGGKPGQPDWNSYLPKLRKNLVEVDPMQMSGNIWPQKKRSLTYKPLNLDGITGRIQKQQKPDKLKSERTSGSQSPMMNSIIKGQIGADHPSFERFTGATTSKFMSPILTPMRTKYSLNGAETETKILDSHAVTKDLFDKSILNKQVLDKFSRGKAVVKKESQNTIPITENVKVVNDDEGQEPEVATLKLEATNQFQPTRSTFLSDPRKATNNNYSTRPQSLKRKEQPSQLIIQKMSPTEITGKEFKKLMKSPFRTKANYNVITERKEQLLVQEDDKCHLTVNINNKTYYDSPARKNRELKHGNTLEKVTLGPGSNSQYESKTGLFRGVSPSLKAITHVSNGECDSPSPKGMRQFDPPGEDTQKQFVDVVTKRYQKEGFDNFKSQHASSYLEKVDKIREETIRTQMDVQDNDQAQDPSTSFNPQMSMLNRRLNSHASLNKNTGIDGQTLVISPSGQSKKSPSTLSHGSFQQIGSPGLGKQAPFNSHSMADLSVNAQSKPILPGNTYQKAASKSKIGYQESPSKTSNKNSNSWRNQTKIEVDANGKSLVHCQNEDLEEFETESRKLRIPVGYSTKVSDKVEEQSNEGPPTFMKVKKGVKSKLIRQTDKQVIQSKTVVGFQGTIENTMNSSGFPSPIQLNPTMGLLSPCDSATDTEVVDKIDSKRSSKYGSIGERLYRQSIRNVDSNLVQSPVIAKLDSRNHQVQGPAFSHSGVSKHLQLESQTNVNKISPLEMHLKHTHATHGSTQDISPKNIAAPFSQQEIYVDVNDQEQEQVLNSLLSDAPRPTRDVSHSTIPAYRISKKRVIEMSLFYQPSQPFVNLAFKHSFKTPFIHRKRMKN